MRKIRVGLSVSEFNKAAEKVDKYKKEVIRKTRILAERLAEEGVKIAKVKISSYPAVDTGELLESMKHEPGDVFRYGSKWIIFTDSDHAAYVEFGTGIVGSRSPHPDTSLSGWRYDINDHGEAGWYYFKNGKWNWTKGMESRPFMYETGRELAMKISKIAKEVFKDD